MKLGNTVNFSQEGVDHIRIDRYAETELGEILTYTYSKRFTIPGLGQFRSPVCFANWLITGNERDRFNFNKLDERPREFHNYILYGKYWQLYSMRRFLASLPEIHLPFTLYSVTKGGEKVIAKHISYAFHMKNMIFSILKTDIPGKAGYNWSEEILKSIDDRVELMKSNAVKPVISSLNYDDTDEPEEVPSYDNGKKKPKPKKKKPKAKKTSNDIMEELSPFGKALVKALCSDDDTEIEVEEAEVNGNV